MARREKSPEDFSMLAAVALGYDVEDDRAPFVVAKGKGLLARKIIEIAEAHGIPVKQNKDLVEILSRLDLGEEIPEEVYPVIAEMLAYIYKMNSAFAPAK